MAEELKEKLITFEDKIEKKYKDKPFWEVVSDSAAKFTIWDKAISDAIKLNEEVKVRYEIKKGEKYTNFTIKAISTQKEDGTWSDWVEGAKFGGGKGGFKAFDSLSANKRTCLQAASQIVAAQLVKTTLANPVASVIDMTAKLMLGVFGEKTVVPEPVKAAVAPVKKQVVVDDEVVEDLEASVPF